MSEQTLVLIKPDGVKRNLIGEIIRRIEAKGYVISDLKKLTPSKELLAEHYAEHVGKPFYEPLVEFMASGDVVAPPRHRCGTCASLRGAASSPLGATRFRRATSCH